MIQGISYQPNDGGGWNWNGRGFSGSQFDDGFDVSNWEAYCGELEKATPGDTFQRRPVMKANWAIDDGSRIIACDGAVQVISENWQHYQPWLEAEVRHSSRLQRPFNEDKKTDGMQSFLLWLLRVSKWLPCKDGSRHSGSFVFRPDGNVAKTIPAFVPFLDEVAVSSAKAPKSFLLAAAFVAGGKRFATKTG